MGGVQGCLKLFKKSESEIGNGNATGKVLDLASSSLLFLNAFQNRKIKPTEDSEVDDPIVVATSLEKESSPKKFNESGKENLLNNYDRDSVTGVEIDNPVVGRLDLDDKMGRIGDLEIGKLAPLFTAKALIDNEFKDLSLEDYKGKYIVLFFYPLDFTFVCPTEIIAFSDRADEFRQINCEIIGASTDSHFSHFAWVQTPRKAGGLGPMNIPLVADKTGEIAKKYGIYKEDEGIAFRGLFIIDPNLNLRQITINDLPVGRSVEETFRLVQAFQFTDKHGEVCPAGWKPGQKTIKPSIDESKDYFKDQ